MEEAKITTLEKTRNPKKVEAGKRLGAVSRQAKAEKAKKLANRNSLDQEANGYISEYVDVENIDPLTAVGIVGVIGSVAYYGYLCYKKKSSSSEDSKDSPKNSEDSKDSPKEPKDLKERKYRQLDTLG